MSSLFYRYQEYTSSIYNALIQLAVIASLLVLGWIILNAVFSKSKLRQTMEYIYLAACAGIYITLFIQFAR